MNNKEFNEKYVNYIEDGFESQGLMISDGRVIDFLDEIFGEVLIHIPGFKYSQIKVKFNSSRIYVDNVPVTMTYWMEKSVNTILEK